MKGKIITQTVYEGWLAYSHGMGFEIKRVIVPEADSLAITPHDDQLYVWTGFEEEGKGFKVLKEIEVPDELVEKAKSFLKTRDELKSKFEALIEE